MTTLHVAPALTETTPGEFVTDGFQVQVDGTPVYQSRSPLKAVIKAAVLTTDERFIGASVTYAEGVAEAAGKLNLSLMLDAQRFQAIREMAMLDTGEVVEGFVGHAKEHGNHVALPDTPPTEG